MKVKHIPTDVINSKSPYMSEDQIEAMIWGYFYRVARTCDRRGGKSKTINMATGLPETPNDLLPIHRAVYGTELALSTLIPPENWVKAVLYTDEFPENVGVPQDQKDWKALSNKSPNDWTMEEVLVVKENTRRLKRVIHREAEKGCFVTSPMIDEFAAELGTDRLVHGEDGMTMGFKITWKGVTYAELFVKAHPMLKKSHTILDSIGEHLAKQAPEWKKRDLANSSLEIT